MSRTRRSPQIRPYAPGDLAEWLRLRGALRPYLARDVVAEDAAEWLTRDDAAVFVAVRPRGSGLAGFVEVGARACANGCVTSPVAFLEAWYVDPDARHIGVGAALVHAAEAWARARGYQEFASDTLLENVESQQAHVALGFGEVERSVKYAKWL